MSLSPEPPTNPSPSPEAPLEDVELALDSQAEASLPIPVGPLRSHLGLSREEPQRPSIWRRITMRKRANDSAGAPGGAEVAARLGAIGQQLEQLDTTLNERLEALNGRLEEVWEAEEQLSQLADIQEKLDRSAQFQDQLSKSIASVRRILGWLAVLVVVAAGAGFVVNQFL